MRIVNDFAGQEDASIGESFPRLIRVIDGPIHAVTEAELPREMDCQPPGVIGEILGFDPLDEGAVVVLGQHAGDGVLEVEAFAEDEGGHSPKRDFPHVRRQRIDG